MIGALAWLTAAAAWGQGDGGQWVYGACDIFAPIAGTAGWTNAREAIRTNANTYSAGLQSGCERDPSFFGIWDLDAIEVDGVRQADAGVLEILDSSELRMLLRYTWDGGFVPDPNPQLIGGGTSASENDDVLDDYQQRGEVYALTLDAFAATFAVVRYSGDQAVLEADAAIYPRPALQAPDPDTHAISLEWSR